MVSLMLKSTACLTQALEVMLAFQDVLQRTGVAPFDYLVYRELHEIVPVLLESSSDDEPTSGQVIAYNSLLSNIEIWTALLSGPSEETARWEFLEGRFREVSDRAADVLKEEASLEAKDPYRRVLKTIRCLSASSERLMRAKKSPDRAAFNLLLLELMLETNEIGLALASYHYMLKTSICESRPEHLLLRLRLAEELDCIEEFGAYIRSFSGAKLDRFHELCALDADLRCHVERLNGLTERCAAFQAALPLELQPISSSIH